MARVSSSRPGVRTAVLMTGTWLAGAAVAVAVGFFAIGRVGDDLHDGGSRPMSAAELHEAVRAEAEHPSPAVVTSQVPPAPTSEQVAPPGPATGPDPPAPGSFETTGGVVAATCSGPVISLRFAYPADGYTAQVQAHPSSIEAEFSAQGDDQHLEIRCVDGFPARFGDPHG